MNSDIAENPEELVTVLAHQLRCLDPRRHSASDILQSVKLAQAAYESCVAGFDLKYYDDRSPDPRHTDQWATFLYLAARHSEGDLRTDIFRLNKALHSLDIYPDVRLPEHFLLSHSVGTVVGRAEIGDYLALHQNCTIGGSLDLFYPTIGSYVAMFPGSMVLGNSKVGDNVFISAGTVVSNQTVPSNSLCFGVSPELVIKPTQRSVLTEVFRKRQPVSDA